MLKIRILMFVLLVVASLSSHAQKTLIAGKFPEGVIDATKETRVKLSKIPASLDELKNYECVIITSDNRSAQKNTLSEAQARALRQYVFEGGSLLITGGKSALIGFEPFSDEPGTFAVNKEAPLRTLMPVYSEPIDGGYGRFGDYGVPRMGPGGKAVSMLEIKEDYPEFQKYLNPRLDFSGFNFVEKRPETNVVAYTVMKKPEEHGYMEKVIFGFTGRRGVLAIPVEGKSKSAKFFNNWPSHIAFLKSCLELLGRQKTGAFIRDAAGPEKLIVGENQEFVLELLNADSSPGKYKISAFLYQQGFFKLEKLLELKNLAVCEIPAKGRNQVKCQVSIAPEFSAEPGKYQLVFTLTDLADSKVEHSIYLRKTLERKIEITLNPGAPLSFNDQEDAELKVRIDGNPSNTTLKILVTYNGAEIMKESKKITGKNIDFKLRTADLPYGEYRAKLQVLAKDGKLLTERDESFFLDPKYEKDDFRLGLVSWFWYTHQLNRYYIKNMRRLGMSLCRGNFAVANWVWKAPVWIDKKTGQKRLFDELLKKNMLSINDYGEILCSDKNLTMEPTIDISYWYTYPLPDYYRYGMEVLPIIGPSCLCWDKTWPAPWIYDLFSHVGGGKPIHYQMDHKGNYAKTWSNIRTSIAFKPMVELENNHLEQLVKKLDQKYSKIIPGYQVQNEPNIFFTPARRGVRDFNPSNLVAFREWLKEKYKTLKTFNELFEQKYQNWNEIEPPRQAGGLGVGGPAALLAEFKAYEDNLMANWLDGCMGAVHKANPEKLCGTNSIHWVDADRPKYGGSILNGNNYFIFASKPNIDYLGQSDHSNLIWEGSLVYDTIYSAAHAYNKFGWVTEGGNYYNLTTHYIESKIWRSIFHGSRVYTMFSQPFFKAGRTSNMFNHDMSISEKSRAFGRPATFTRDNRDLVKKSLPYGQNVGILLLPESNYLSFAVSGKLWPLTNFHALYKLLHYQNVPVRILDKEALARGDLKDLKLIIVPDFKFGLEDKYLKALKQYFDAGGNVLTFGRFGFQDQYFRPAIGPEILNEMGISVARELSKNLFCKVMTTGDEGLKGHFYVPLTVDKSKKNEIIGSTTSGKPAIVRHGNGKSFWYYCATNMPKSECKNPDWIKFLSGIMKESGVVNAFDLLDKNGRKLSLEHYAMRNPKNRACFAWVYNPGNACGAKVKFYAPDLTNARFYDFDRQIYLETSIKNGFFETELKIPAQCSMILGLLPEGVTIRKTKVPTFRPAFIRPKRSTPTISVKEEVAEDTKFKLSSAHAPESSSKEKISATDGEGFVKDWNIIGPFANPLSTSRSVGNEDGIDLDTGKIEGRGYDIDYLKPFGGEKNLKVPVSASVTFSFPKRDRETLWETATKLDDLKISWVSHQSEEPFVDLSKIYPMPPEFTVAYAVCEIESDRDREVLFRLGSDDGFKLYLNGEELGARRLRRRAQADDDSLFAELKKGRNQVVFKIGQDTGGFGFYFRLTDLTGVPITDLKIISQIEKKEK